MPHEPTPQPGEPPTESGGSSSDALIEALRSGAYGLGADIGPQFIGVPGPVTRSLGDEPLTVAQMREAAEQQGGDVTIRNPRGGTPTLETQPVWTEGSENKLLSMSPEDIRRLQRSLVATGLLPGKFRKGLPDDKTLGAYKSLLGWANRLGTGRDLNATLNALASAPELVEGTQEGDEDYLPPDYATLAQKVKGVFRSHLRRDPSEAEVTILADELRGGFDAAAQAERDAMLASTITNDAQATPEGFVGPPTAEQVEAANAEVEQEEGRIDPESRFMEAFESRYANELDTLEGEDEAGRTQQVVTSGSNLLARLIGR